MARQEGEHTPDSIWRECLTCFEVASSSDAHRSHTALTLWFCRSNLKRPSSCITHALRWGEVDVIIFLGGVELLCLLLSLLWVTGGQEIEVCGVSLFTLTSSHQL